MPRPSKDLPEDYSKKIRELRGKLALSQERFAELLGVSFATVNRWENGQSRPAKLAWMQILKVERDGAIQTGEEMINTVPQNMTPMRMDFTSRPEVVKAIAERHRLSYGHLFQPRFCD